MINRKQFLGLFAAQALTATLSTAQAQGKTVIRFSSPSPMNDPLLRAMQMFKEEVEKMWWSNLKRHNDRFFQT